MGMFCFINRHVADMSSLSEGGESVIATPEPPARAVRPMR